MSILIKVHIYSRGILKAARRLLKRVDNPSVTNMTTPTSSVAPPPPQKFYWLASDGWGKQGQVVAGLEDFAVGAITVELESKRIQGELNPYSPWPCKSSQVAAWTNSLINQELLIIN